jgi:hypothetical protein
MAVARYGRRSMLTSVFTPSHRPRFLDACYRSLAGQTVDTWEWVVLLNGSARDWHPPVADERVKVIRSRVVSKKVGALKREACGECRGDILLELDHDDILAPGCIEAVQDAVRAHPDASLVYSDCTQIKEDGSPDFDTWDSAWGWVYSSAEIDGITYQRCGAMAAYPHNVGYIWYAPNHLRAIPRARYEEVGGYNADRHVLDDQDLMIRLFMVGDFHHIPECLYLQRVHSQNTQVDPTTNAFIQQQTVSYYQEHIEAMAEAWCRRRGLMVLSLRTPTTPHSIEGNDDQRVLIDPQRPALAIGTDSVGLIRANELLQRVADREALFNECHRALVHGGLVLTMTPSTDGRGAFQDPSHIAFYNENSFWYLTEATRRSSVPSLTARLQVSHIRTFFPTSWHEDYNVPYVQANLLAIKDGPRLGGPLLC